MSTRRLALTAVMYLLFMALLYALVYFLIHHELPELW